MWCAETCTLTTPHGPVKGWTIVAYILILSAGVLQGLLSVRSRSSLLPSTVDVHCVKHNVQFVVRPKLNYSFTVLSLELSLWK